MAGKSDNNKPVGFIYSFALAWLVLSLIFPLHELWGLALVALVSTIIALIFGKAGSSRRKKKAEKRRQAEEKAAANVSAARSGQPIVSYGPEIDPILKEGNRALAEMGRLYASIKDVQVRQKINELMRITDKITQDAIADPSDIPQIKKFMNYYLPTTIKLLNSYDRMSAQGIEGENLNKSMASINEMLDEAIVAYKKRLDSLFENQALDIETDIEVMNTMLAREGLTGRKDFEINQERTLSNEQ